MSKLCIVNIAKKGEKPFYTWGVPNGKGGYGMWSVNGLTWGIPGEQPPPRTKRAYWTIKRWTHQMLNKLPAIIENIDIIEEIIKRLFRKTHPPTYR